MALGVGSILAGRYAIGRVIGKGGFGVTYLAYDMKLECRVAVKEYYPYGLAAREPGSTHVSVSSAEAEETFKNGAEKFYNEARLVAKFNGNPNIVSVHDFFYENDTVYFTMGYLEGMTLKAYLKEYGALPLEKALYVAEVVSNALMVAHSMNVLHRDISPDNIMVCKDGTIRLLDFGAARQVVTEGSQSLSVILKQGFAPLEQYQKKGKQGPWTDIYSLGATLYYALTLDTLDDPMSRLEDDEEYSSNCHQIDAGFWQIIKKATALRIADRYQDIFELKKDLNSFSVKPEMLVEPESAADMVSQRFAAKAFGSTERTAQRQEENAVGMTMPLQEEDTVGVTMPLQEEDTVGMTVPLQEGETTGETTQLTEAGKHAVMAESLEEKEQSEMVAKQTEEKTIKEAEASQETERQDNDAEEVGGEKPKRKQQGRKKKWIVGAAIVAVAAILMFAVGRKFILRNVIMEDPLAYMDDMEIIDMIGGMEHEEIVKFDEEKKTSKVFGNSDLERSDIRKISFLNTKKDMPSDAWDISKARNGTVMAWTDEADVQHLYIAAKGKIVVKSARRLFVGYSNLEEIESIDCLDTRQATDMSSMFNGCSSLSSLDVSSFDTRQVTDMSSMFYGCSSLSSVDVSSFDTSQVTSMWGMFENCSGLRSLNVSGFDTSQVTDMDYMFRNCSSLRNLDVSGFDMGREPYIWQMFDGAGITAEEAGLPQ